MCVYVYIVLPTAPPPPVCEQNWVYLEAALLCFQ